MKLDRKFNELSLPEYIHCIENHKDYSDFNTLGLYRSILENEQLSLDEKIQVKDFANTIFGKTYKFLQVKDPRTYFELETLGQELTVADEAQIWRTIQQNQEKILAAKRIKHRNFGDHSKHNCGHPDCPMDGLMIRQDSWLTEYHMVFYTDKNKNGAKEKSKQRKKDRKNAHQFIQRDLDWGNQ